MDERCRRAHAKLLAGICPWCGQPIINGQPPAILAPTSAILPHTGVSLRTLVARSGPLDVEAVTRYIEEVAKQLTTIHRAGEVYRDIRPDYIFVDERGIAKLGVGPIFPAVEFVTEAESTIVGVVDFLAPEVALQSHSVDARSDIYSLGCTMYFLLTGRPPFPNGSISERLLQHQTATPDTIQSLRPDVPIAVVSICETMMAKKPDDRFQTATEVADAITALRTT